LTRLTGIRIGECIHLPLNCLRQIGPEQWALHVPLGKLHTARLVPLDSEGLRLLNRIQELRAMASPARLAKSKDFLLLRVGGRFALFQMLRMGRWPMPPNEPAAPTANPSRLTACGTPGPRNYSTVGLGCQPS